MTYLKRWIWLVGFFFMLTFFEFYGFCKLLPNGERRTEGVKPCPRENGDSLPVRCTSFTTSHEQWMRVRDLKEFEFIIKKQERQKELKTLCFLQLEKKRVPHFCYEWLKYKKPEHRELFLPYLNEKCQEFSTSLKNPQKIKKILQKKHHLNPFCYKALYKQRKRIEYQLRDQALSHIFQWYFTEEEF